MTPLPAHVELHIRALYAVPREGDLLLRMLLARRADNVGHVLHAVSILIDNGMVTLADVLATGTVDELDVLLADAVERLRTIADA